MQSYKNNQHITEDFDFNKVKPNNILNDYKLWVQNFMSMEELYEELKLFDDPADFIEFYFNKINKSRLHEILIKLINDKDLSTLLSISYKDVEINQSYVTYTLVDLDANDYKNFVIDKHKDDQDFVILCGLLVSSLELGVMSLYTDALDDFRDSYIYALSLEGSRKGGGNFTYWEYKFINDNDKFKADYDEVLYDTFYDRFNEETMNLLLDYLNYGHLDEDFDFNKIKPNDILDEYEIKINNYNDWKVFVNTSDRNYKQQIKYVYSIIDIKLIPNYLQDIVKGYPKLERRDVEQLSPGYSEYRIWYNFDKICEYITDLKALLFAGLLQNIVSIHLLGEIDIAWADPIEKEDYEYPITIENTWLHTVLLVFDQDKQILNDWEVSKNGDDTTSEYLYDTFNSVFDAITFDSCDSYTDDLIKYLNANNSDNYDYYNSLTEDFDFNNVQPKNTQDEYKIDRKLIIKNIPASITPVDVLYRKYNIDITYNHQRYSEEFGYYQFNNEMHLISTPWVNSTNLEKELYQKNFLQVTLKDIPDYILDFVDNIVLLYNRDSYIGTPFTSDNITDINAYVSPDNGVFIITFILFERNKRKMYKRLYITSAIYGFTGLKLYNERNIKPVNEDFDFNKIQFKNIQDEYTIIESFRNFETLKNYIKYNGSEAYNKIVLDYIGEDKIWDVLLSAVVNYWVYNIGEEEDYMKLIGYGVRKTEYAELNILFNNIDQAIEYEDDLNIILALGMLTYSTYVQMSGIFENKTMYVNDDWNNTGETFVTIDLPTADLLEIKLIDKDTDKLINKISKQTDKNNSVLKLLDLNTFRSALKLYIESGDFIS